MQLVINIFLASSVILMVAVSFAIIYQTTRFFHFAHGVVYAVGAYFAYSLSVSLGINPILSFFFASILAAILGIAIDRIVYQPLRINAAPGLVFLIASFGVFIFIQNLLQLLQGKTFFPSILPH